MPFELLHERLPELAELETRTVMVLSDPDYMARVKRHYRLFRSTVDLRGNPLLLRRRTVG